GRAAGLLSGLAGISVSAKTIERSAEASGAAARAAAQAEAAGFQSRPEASLIAWSRIARPRGSSSSVAVSGGASARKPPPPRGDPENAAHSGQLHDVHVQAQIEAASGDQRAQLVGAAFGPAVDDQFQAGQQATSADVAHDLVPAGDLFEAMPEDAAQVAGPLV